jgi:hypothetical protein
MGDKDIGKLYSESVSKRKFDTISNRFVTEAYMLTIADDETGNIVYTSEIDNEKMDSIQRDLERSQKIKLDSGKEMTVYELIDKCFEIDGWKKGNKNYESQVLEPAKKYINNVNINRELFGNLLHIQSDPNNLIRTELLANPGTRHNYLDLISQDAFEVFASYQDAHFFIDKLWGTTTSIGNSNVGNGEIVMGLFSDAVKGSRGDLYMKGLGEIEVKGSGARMGAGKFAQMKTKNELNKILQDREVTVDIEVLNDYKKYMTSILQNMKQQIPGSERLNISQQLQQEINNISDVTDFDELNKTIQDSEYITKGVKTQLSSGVNKAKNRALGVEGPGNPKGTFRDAVNVFFRSNWNLLPDEIVEGVVSCRANPDEDIVDEIRLGVTAVLNSGLDILDSDHKDSNLLRLIAAIHVSSYRHHEKFNYIIFANDDTKEMVSLKFDDGESISMLIPRTFKFFTDHNASINPSLDDRMGTVGVSI